MGLCRAQTCRRRPRWACARRTRLRWRPCVSRSRGRAVGRADDATRSSDSTKSTAPATSASRSSGSLANPDARKRSRWDAGQATLPVDGRDIRWPIARRHGALRPEPSHGAPDLLADDDVRPSGAIPARPARRRCARGRRRQVVRPRSAATRRDAFASESRRPSWQCRSAKTRSPARCLAERDRLFGYNLRRLTVHAEYRLTRCESDFLKKSKCSRARPVPSATQLSGSRPRGRVRR
jgi:hypothetical protein